MLPIVFMWVALLAWLPISLALALTGLLGGPAGVFGIAFGGGLLCMAAGLCLGYHVERRRDD